MQKNGKRYCATNAVVGSANCHPHKEYQLDNMIIIIVVAILIIIIHHHLQYSQAGEEYSRLGDLNPFLYEEG